MTYIATILGRQYTGRQATHATIKIQNDLLLILRVYYADGGPEEFRGWLRGMQTTSHGMRAWVGWERFASDRWTKDSDWTASIVEILSRSGRVALDARIRDWQICSA